MGAIKGGISVRRYLVKGDKPRELAKLLKGVRAHAFLPIDPKSDVERSHGWACLEDPDDLDLTSDKVLLGDVLGLALRVDTLRPPASVVKRLVAEKLKELGRRPNKAERTAAKDEVKRKLRGRYLPTTRTVDVLWQPEEGVVWFWSQTKSMNELLVELFAKSFGVELVALGPALFAGRGAITTQLSPTPEMLIGFTGFPGRSDALTDEEDAHV